MPHRIPCHVRSQRTGPGRIAPERHNLVRVRADWDAERARQAEVSELQLAEAIDQEVLKKIAGSVGACWVYRLPCGSLWPRVLDGLRTA